MKQCKLERRQKEAFHTALPCKSSEQVEIILFLRYPPQLFVFTFSSSFFLSLSTSLPCVCFCSSHELPFSLLSRPHIHKASSVTPQSWHAPPPPPRPSFFIISSLHLGFHFSIFFNFYLLYKKMVDRITITTRCSYTSQRSYLFITWNPTVCINSLTCIIYISYNTKLPKCSKSPFFFLFFL